jgi:hypothetical protein
MQGISMREHRGTKVQECHGETVEMRRQEWFKNQKMRGIGIGSFVCAETGLMTWQRKWGIKLPKVT